MKKRNLITVAGAIICFVSILFSPQSFSGPAEEPGPAFCLQPQTYETGSRDNKDWCWCDKPGDDECHGRIRECKSGSYNCQEYKCLTDLTCCYVSTNPPPPPEE